MDEQIEIDLDLLQKAKTRKRVWVKPTATKKGYYREQEVGQKEIEKKPPRKDTGKIASLPEDIKKEILDLRRLGDSGASIKSQIENMIDASDDPKIKDNLAAKGILKSSSSPASLNVTGQSLVDWAKARGVESRKKRKTVKAVETAAKEIEETRFKEANEKLARLQTENKMLQGQLDVERKSKAESDSIREKLRNENYILREKLKGLGKPVKEPVKETDNKKLVAQYLAGIEYSSKHLKSAKIEKSAGNGRLQIEIDLNVFNKAQDEGASASRPGLVKKKVTVKRGGKTFQQYRWIKAGDEEAKERNGVEEKPKKELAIIGLNKPEPENEEKPKSEAEKPEITKKIKSVKQAKEVMKSHISTLENTNDGKDLLDGIRDYTGGDFKRFNSYLRSGKVSRRAWKGKVSEVKPNKTEKREIDEEMDKVSDFIKSAPKMEGNVYRGMVWGTDKKSIKSFGEFMDQMSIGSEVEFPAFSSTSSSESVATDFAAKAEKSSAAVIKMKSKSGVYLDGTSAFKDEHEVLFDRNSKFTVTKIDKGTDPIRITLKEV